MRFNISTNREYGSENVKHLIQCEPNLLKLSDLRVCKDRPSLSPNSMSGKPKLLFLYISQCSLYCYEHETNDFQPVSLN